METEEFINALTRQVKKINKNLEAASTRGSKKQSVENETDVVEVIKPRVLYDDVFGWIREHLKSEYNGVYVIKTRAKLLDKGDYNLRLCFAIDGEPQTGADDPVIVYTFDIMDDALKDMLSEKNKILIKINKNK